MNLKLSRKAGTFTVNDTPQFATTDLSLNANNDLAVVLATVGPFTIDVADQVTASILLGGSITTFKSLNSLN